MNRNIRIFVFLLALTLLFELMPFVDNARMFITKDIGDSCDCFCALLQRPWYGRINTWLIFWIVSTPLIVFSFKAEISVWKKTLYFIIAITTSYIVLNLSTHLGMEIRNAPFHTDMITSTSSDFDKARFNCFDIADGGKYAFALFFGWIPASIYVGFWFIVRWLTYFFKRKK